jgi:Zn-dependent protease with chaperone function
MRALLVVLCWAMAAFLVWEALQRSVERGIVTGLLALAAGAAFVASIVILRWNRQG